MKQDDLTHCNNWFSTYTQSFSSSNREDWRNILLKVKHSYKVRENMIQIANEQQLDRKDVILAEVSALFHDIGRFIQYKKYKTFNDSESVNHGKLGAEVIREEKVLHHIDEDEQELILNTIKLHNVFKIPDLQTNKKLLLLRLTRDADKLDILRVFDEYYGKSASERASVAAHGLSDIPGCSQKILSCFPEKKSASMKDVKSLNDFKLLQLSWIYELHFNTSYKLLLERKFINKYIDKLPETEEIREISSSLHAYARGKARSSVSFS
jgi:putative nucleotidyltransferase with HDIG domain